MPKAPSSTPDYTRPKACPFCGEKLLIVFFNLAKNPCMMGIHGWECIPCHSTFSKQGFTKLPTFVYPVDEEFDRHFDDEDPGVSVAQ